MVAIEGPMESYFKGQSVPAPANAEGRKEQSDAAVRVVGLGSAVPLIPEALKGGLAGNPALKDVPTLLLNICDWLLSEKGLMEVRGKTAEPPPFKNPPPDGGHQRKFTWLLIVGWPVIFVALSLGAMVLVRAYRRGPNRNQPPARRSLPKDAPDRADGKAGREEAEKKEDDDAGDEASGKEVQP
jgi:hypothetical protein